MEVYMRRCLNKRLFIYVQFVKDLSSVKMFDMKNCRALFIKILIYSSLNMLIVEAQESESIDLRLPALHQLTEPFEHGEGPVWDHRVQLLYFVDIHEGKVLSYDPQTRLLNSIQMDGDVTPVIPHSNDTSLFYIGINRSVATVRWPERSSPFYEIDILNTVQEDTPDSRFNDGKADAKGRLWFGTMGYENSSGVIPNEGIFYKITRENLEAPAEMIAPVNISNGIAWTADNSIMYYIDTPTQKVKKYDFDLESGDISNEEVAVDLKDYNIDAYPDGMTIDADDNLWIALYNGGSVIQVDPKTKQLLRQIAIPAQCVTSVSWGGPKNDILFVTTSRFALNDQERQKQPAAGALFAVTNLGTYGLMANFGDI